MIDDDNLRNKLTQLDKLDPSTRTTNSPSHRSQQLRTWALIDLKWWDLRRLRHTSIFCVVVHSSSLTHLLLRTAYQKCKEDDPIASKYVGCLARTHPLSRSEKGLDKTSSNPCSTFVSYHLCSTEGKGQDGRYCQRHEILIDLLRQDRTGCDYDKEIVRRMLGIKFGLRRVPETKCSRTSRFKFGYDWFFDCPKLHDFPLTILDRTIRYVLLECSEIQSQLLFARGKIEMIGRGAFNIQWPPTPDVLMIF